MLNHIGLYYPTIGFSDDAWVKLAALYWDKLGRIVPSGIEVDDSDTVKQLINEVGFIDSFVPSDQELSIAGEMFLTALGQHLEQLKKMYDIDSRHKLSESASEYHPFIQGISNVGFIQGRPGSNQTPKLYTTLDKLPSNVGFINRPFATNIEILSDELKLDPALSYIVASGKMIRPLSEALVSAKLASYITGDGNYPSLIGMHPKLAFIYMEVLAEQMASSRQMYPVTNNVLNHVASSGYSVERLVQVLLSSHVLPQKGFPSRREHQPAAEKLAQLLPTPNTSPSTDEIEVQMATIALRSVLPKDITDVPMKKIIKLRTKYQDELTAFQTHLHDLAASLETLQTINDPSALKAHLEVEYEKKLEPQLHDLKNCMKSLGIDTTIGALNIRVAVPALLVSATPLLHLSVNPIVVGTGAIALSLFPVIQQKQKDAKQIVRSSPAAYLFYVQENLEPANLISQITKCARQFVFKI